MLDRVFWLLCGAWVGGFGSFLYSRIKPNSSGQTEAISQQEINRFARGWAISIITPCLAFWCLQLSAGPDASADFTEWPELQRTLASLISLLCWSLLLYWVWIGTGAVQLSKMKRLSQPSSPRILTTPTAYKVICTLSIAPGFAKLMGMWR